MIEINLLPENMRKREAVKLALPEIPIKRTLIILFSVMAALEFISGIFAFQQNMQFAGMKTDLVKLKETTKDVAHKKAETEILKKKLKLVGSIVEKKLYWSALLGDLTNSVTKGVWLRGLSMEEKDMQMLSQATKKAAGEGTRTVQVLKLEGSVFAQGQETAYIGKFIKELKENRRFSEHFDSIELSNINQRKIRDFDVYDFVLFCVFKKDRVGGAA